MGHCFPLKRMTEQHQMIAMRRHASRHGVHTLDTCFVAIVNRYKPQWDLFSITASAKYAFLIAASPLSLLITGGQQTYTDIFIQDHRTHRVMVAEGRRTAARRRAVGAPWCASAGFHLPVPWLPLPGLIENIPWNFLTLPRPRHRFTHTHTQISLTKKKLFASCYAGQ